MKFWGIKNKKDLEMKSPPLLVALGLMLLIIEQCTAAPTTYTAERRIRVGMDQELIPDNAQLKSYSEFTEVRAPNMPEQVLIQQAKDAGMDEVAVAELLRTKNPVITTTRDAQGHTRTITYKLTPEGGISRQTVTEKETDAQMPTEFSGLNFSSRNTAGKSATNILDRSGFDELVEPPELATTTAASKLEHDWEWTGLPRKNTRTYTFSGTKPFGLDHSFGNSFDKDLDNVNGIFERRHKPSESGDNGANSWFHSFGIPKLDGVTPRTISKTEVDDQGRTRTTTTTIFDSGPITTNWSNRGFSNFPSIFNNDEDFLLRPKPSLPGTANDIPQRPSFANFPNTVDESKKPNPVYLPDLDDILKPRSTTPLPSIDDFLRAQYTTTGSSKHFLTDSSTTPKTIATINIDGLHGGTTDIHRPIDEAWLHDLTSFEADASAPATESKTKVSTYSSTVTSEGKPKISDLDGNMQTVLLRAGITPEEIESSNGNSITRTRIGPEGQTITTTYRVRTLPSSTYTTAHQMNKIEPNFGSDSSSTQRDVTFQTLLPRIIPNTLSSYSHKEQGTVFPTFDSSGTVPTTTASPIDSFLSKVNLKPSDIEAQKGQIVKTLVDGNGRVLSASFVLSSVKGDAQEPKVKPDK